MNFKINQANDFTCRLGCVSEESDYLNHTSKIIKDNNQSWGFQINSNGKWSIQNRFKANAYPFVFSNIYDFNPLEGISFRNDSLIGYSQGGLQLYLRHYSNARSALCQ